MKQTLITVYNYGLKPLAPYKMIVNAFCAGGEEGVFAVFRMPTDPKLIGFANGDDGHWKLSTVKHESWMKNIAEAINAIGE